MRRSEIDVRRREDARAHRELGLRTERAERAIFEHAQELGLELGGHLGDLVEQERAAAARARAGRARGGRRR